MLALMYKCIHFNTNVNYHDGFYKYQFINKCSHNVYINVNTSINVQMYTLM